MGMILEILMDSLLGAILITGLVIIMMIMIESLNIESKGRFFEGLGRSKVGEAEPRDKRVGDGKMEAGRE